MHAFDADNNAIERCGVYQASAIGRYRKGTTSNTDWKETFPLELEDLDFLVDSGVFPHASVVPTVDLDVRNGTTLDESRESAQRKRSTRLT